MEAPGRRAGTKAGMKDSYDLIVIGAGPAGEKGAAQAAYFGKSVALVEMAEVPGGAGVNSGTLPSKTLRETALHLTGFRHRGLYGVDMRLRREVEARDFLHRAPRVARAEHRRIADNLARHGIDTVRGRARFVEPHVIEVSRDAEPGLRLGGEVFLIATGSSPRRPTDLPFEDSRIYDSDTILDIDKLPERLLVVGGGVVGAEYACMFAALDIQVHLVDGRDRLLGFMDDEISAVLAREMIGMGVELLLKQKVEAVETGDVLTVRLASGRRFEVDALLAATGRLGNSADMGLEDVGIDVGPRGHIEVDDCFRTSLSHVHAVGDVIGFPALASTSMEQARVAMVHAFDLGYKTALAAILPFGIYTIPECSMAGATEESLIEANVDYVAGRARFADNARGRIVGDDSGFLKLLFETDSMRLLGVHVIGEQASELVHIGLTALLCEAKAELFIQTCYNHPTLSEVYKYAAYDAIGERDRRRPSG